MRKISNRIINPTLYTYSLFFIIISSIMFCNEMFAGLHLNWWANILIILLIPIMLKCAVSNKEPLYTSYFILMLIGFLFHLSFYKDIPINRNFVEVIRWISVAFLLWAADKQKNNFFWYFAIIFFLSECCVAIYERLTLSRLIEYSSEMYESTVLYGELDTSFFRSCSLLGHPLDNANIVSIFMAYILVNHRLNKLYKIFLLLIGMGALWAFNSRGAILIWLIIFSYRFVFYNRRIVYVLIASILFLIIWPFVVDFLNSGALGRFTLDFSDASSQTRLNSFLFFYLHDWDIESILMGGKLLYMPGTDLLLENGVLLNLGYWGWIIGLLKIVIEICLTYKLLFLYNKQEKFIIMLAFWGVGLMNNNTFNTLCFIFFLFAYAAFYCNEKRVVYK